jgi:hypothetical protein
MVTLPHQRSTSLRYITRCRQTNLYEKFISKALLDSINTRVKYVTKHLILNFSLTSFLDWKSITVEYLVLLKKSSMRGQSSKLDCTEQWHSTQQLGVVRIGQHLDKSTREQLLSMCNMRLPRIKRLYA